jgi:hypothetical protein
MPIVKGILALTDLARGDGLLIFTEHEFGSIFFQRKKESARSG